jgi:small subunit ribosomal protein S1
MALPGTPIWKQANRGAERLRSQTDERTPPGAPPATGWAPRRARTVVAAGEHFDPTLYGMTANYDDQGNYIYPEGFDPETNEWLTGYERQREDWERQYAVAQERFDAHRKQVETAQRADSEAGGEREPAPSSYSSTEDSSGTLASDEALARLREKLTGGGS